MICKRMVILRNRLEPISCLYGLLSSWVRLAALSTGVNGVNMEKGEGWKGKEMGVGE